jgi:hypothetical protein
MTKVREGNKNAQKGEDPLGLRVVTLLDDRQLAKLDSYADRHGLKRSAALRRLVEELDGLE